jgi:hypothetical protein
MIYIPTFMETGTGVQAILRVFFTKLKICIIGTTDGQTSGVYRLNRLKFA